MVSITPQHWGSCSQRVALLNAAAEPLGWHAEVVTTPTHEVVWTK